MDKIIQYFGLDKKGANQGNVDFLNVHLNKDNKIFLDYNKIIKFSDTLSSKMTNRIDNFLGALFKYVFNKKSTETSKLLEGLHECNLTKLGMSKAKPSGNSVGNILKELIQLNADYVVAALKTGQFSPDVLYFGIDQIGPDRTSDIIVSIVKQELIEFTQEQCAIHGILLQSTVEKNIFEASTATWLKKAIDLPFYDGSGIIFIPKKFASSASNLNSSFERFLRYGFDNYVKDNSDYSFLIVPGSKNNSVVKKHYNEYKSKNGIKSKDEVKKWIKGDKDALDNFQQILSPYINQLTDDELNEIIGD